MKEIFGMIYNDNSVSNNIQTLYLKHIRFLYSLKFSVCP
jgi:hypothetical protein